MNSKIRLTIILIASFFLVTLGMRTAYLSGGSAPKPRPRAVIETTAKETLDVVQQHEIDATPPPLYLYFVPTQSVTPAPSLPETSIPQFIRTASLVARAPPSPSSLHS